MNARCVRQGQTEVGVVEFQGREFAAFGASVCGKHVTGYTDKHPGRLKTWCGKTMLECRSWVVQECRCNEWGEKGYAIVFALPQGRFICGYALGLEGMLFRGELLLNASKDDAEHLACSIADHCCEQDEEDDLRAQE